MPSPSTNPAPPPFHADRWGQRWSEDGLLLRFSDGATATTVRLDPNTLVALAAQLAEVVARHEQVGGMLWSEDAARLGAITDERLFWQERPMTGRFAAPAERLYRLIRQLPLNGFERSFKLLPGQLLRDRWLVGISTGSLAAADLDFLAAQMGAPADFITTLRAERPAASFVHIGFEAGSTRCSYKLYLEFASGSTSMPLYRGFKWNPLDPAERGVSNYTQPARLALDDVLEKIARRYEADGTSAVCETAQAIVSLAAQRSGAAALMFVDVTDDHSPRLSFDVNLYESGLQVGELRARLLPLARVFGLARDEDLSALVDQTENDLAGHLSGGVDSEGRAFLTLYHARPRKV